MSALKRRASSSRTTRLRAHTSPYNSSVTLFDADSAGLPTSPPRRSKRVKVESGSGALLDVEEAVQDASLPEKLLQAGADSDPSTPRVKGLKSPRKPKPVQQSLATPHPAPTKWREVYDIIKYMRSRTVAPVDTMGCDQAQLKEQDPKASLTFTRPYPFRR